MKLYVGNLPSSFTDQDLKNLFASYGNILSAKIIIDRETGRSKGFGFVEFDSADSGMKAIKEKNKHVVDGKEIVVNEARPLQDRRGPGGPGGGRFGRGGGQGQDRRGENRFSGNKRFSNS